MLILYSVAPIGRIFSYKNDTCICYNVTTVCKSSKQSGFIFLYIVRLRLSPNIFRMEGNKKKYLSKQIKLLTAQSYFRSFFLYTFFFWFNCHLVYMTYCKLAGLIYGFCDVINSRKKKGQSYECWLRIMCIDLI